jgi:hypothetical protein
MTIWFILGSLGTFFPVLGTTYQDKSGKPAENCDLLDDCCRFVCFSEHQLWSEAIKHLTTNASSNLFISKKPLSLLHCSSRTALIEFFCKRSLKSKCTTNKQAGKLLQAEE